MSQVHNLENLYGAIEESACPIDFAQARTWWVKAAAGGQAKSCWNLSLLYRFGRGVQIDADEETKWLKRGAELGDPTAQHTLGYYYLRGSNVSQDLALAMKLAKASASQGFPGGIDLLGLLHWEGAGVPQDDRIAVRLWRQNAAQGWHQSQFNLACALRDGRGESRHYLAAYVWFSRAAEGDIPLAQGKAKEMGRRISAVEKAEADRRISDSSYLP